MTCRVGLLQGVWAAQSQPGHRQVGPSKERKQQCCLPAVSLAAFHAVIGPREAAGDSGPCGGESAPTVWWRRGRLRCGQKTKLRTQRTLLKTKEAVLTHWGRVARVELNRRKADLEG